MQAITVSDRDAGIAGMTLADVQDRLPYMEPPFWYYPIHQSLGSALMAQGAGRR